MATGALKPLEAFLPAYEFSERHSIRVAAPPARIDAAVRTVAAEDMPLVRFLFRLRALGGRTPARKPFVEHARCLDDAAAEGIVLGLTGDFWKPRGNRSGTSCEAVVDFRIVGGTLSTETRVHVEDPAARRKFARYWRVIRPFSGLTRILFLREVRRRAEA